MPVKNYPSSYAFKYSKTSLLIRIFDLIFSIIGLLFFAPLIIVFSIILKFTSNSSIYFVQQRIGRFGKPFKLIKFRTMVDGSEKSGYLTIGNDDCRITKFGSWLRKNKLDEIPQLVNILMGEMSFVGPRPEVKKYVELYSKDQWDVLKVKPGLTDYATIEFYNEAGMLGEIQQTTDPESYYINEIIPRKIELNKYFIENYSLSEYFKIIFLTQLSLSNFRSFLIRNKFTPKWGILLIDLVVTVGSMAIAYYLTNTKIETELLFEILFYTFFFSLVSFSIFKPYNGIILFSGLHETIRIMASVSLIAILAGINYILKDRTPFSFTISTFVVFFFVNVVLLSEYRQLIKFFYTLSIGDKIFSNAVICGAGASSSILINLIENVVNKRYKIVAIIDSEKRLVGKRINELKIYHPDDFDNIISRQKIKKVFYTSDGGSEILSAIREKCVIRNISCSFINLSAMGF